MPQQSNMTQNTGLFYQRFFRWGKNVDLLVFLGDVFELDSTTWGICHHETTISGNVGVVRFFSNHRFLANLRTENNMGILWTPPRPLFKLEVKRSIKNTLEV